ncbi:hypothetical protein H0H87_012904 [Tephrocybe sp. NHM501043]|nr:hypothetical protein H0H87_012904 [Tephrocybe sp. NHM501043]
MGCCGDPIDKSAPQKVEPYNPGIVTQQPGPHPGLEKPPAFQQPTISTPPPTHTYNGAAPAPWGQPMQSQVDQFGGYPMGVTPPVNVQSYPGNGSMFTAPSGFGAMNEPILRPGSAHHRSVSSGSPPYMVVSPPLPKAISPPPDEGKMSVSIDFGTTFSGVVRAYAYGSSRIAGGQVQQILNWPGSPETFRKVSVSPYYHLPKR